MTDAGFVPATFRREGGAIVAEIAMLLDNHVEEVWSALTRPDRLAQWLAPGEIELAEGGRALLDFGDSGVVIDSKVSAFKPQRVLEYSWSGPNEPVRPLRWELEPIGAAVRLTLTLKIPEGEDAARATAGFAAHLEMLAATLAGLSTKFPFLIFKAAREAYGRELAELSATA
jgi:uncharacterized protein YndB with AHSA1/START domain